MFTEQYPLLPTMFDVEEMQPQTEAFRHFVEAHSGVVHAFVHPFFAQHKLDKAHYGIELLSTHMLNYYQRIVNDRKVQTITRQLVNLVKQQNPVLLLEEVFALLPHNGFPALLRSNLSSIGLNQHFPNLLVIPTFNNSGVPNTVDGFPILPVVRMRHFLSQLGIRKVTISGMLLSNKAGFMEGCVAEFAVDVLKAAGNVNSEYSEFVYPGF